MCSGSSRPAGRSTSVRSPWRRRSSRSTAFARQRDAAWVITGWVDRSNWKLRIGISLWKVKPGKDGDGRRRGAAHGRRAELPRRSSARRSARCGRRRGIAVDVARRQKLTRALATRPLRGQADGPRARAPDRRRSARVNLKVGGARSRARGVHRSEMLRGAAPARRALQRDRRDGPEADPRLASRARRQVHLRERPRARRHRVAACGGDRRRRAPASTRSRSSC